MLPLWFATSVYALGVLTTVLMHSLHILEVASYSCHSRAPLLNPGASALVAVQLVLGIFALVPSVVIAAALGVGVAVLTPTGPYIILQAALEGTSVRTQEEAGQACAAVWGPGPHASGLNRVSLLSMLLFCLGALFVLHVVLLQLAWTWDMQGVLEQLSMRAAQTAFILLEMRRKLKAAAAAVLPRAVLLQRMKQEAESDSSMRVSVGGITCNGQDRIRRAKASNGPPQRGIALGESMIATLNLCGYDRIADLAGPVAALGLHRRIGTVVDEVCARYGAIRVRGGAGRFLLGWFESQKGVSRAERGSGGQAEMPKESRSSTNNWKL